MNKLCFSLIGAAFALSAATTALAQTAGSPAAAPSAGTPGGTPPGMTSPGGVQQLPFTPGSGAHNSIPGAVSPNSSVIGSQPSPGQANSGAMMEQAQARHRLALEQCQATSGASRSDCVKRADDDFARTVGPTGTDTLAQQGQGSLAAGTQSSGSVAGNVRTTPDISPTSRDNNSREVPTR
jgi:hypothetical protein